MNIINTYSNLKFILNGTQYLRNYISRVAGDKITVFNCYDNKDVLIEPTHFENFTVNGSTFANPEEVQAALNNIVYSRGTLGNDVTELYQDNIDRRVFFIMPSGYTKAQLVSQINQNPLTVTETQSLWFSIYESGAPAGRYRNYKVMNKGKGQYGPGGNINLSQSDLYEIGYSYVAVTDVEANPETQEVSFGELEGQSVWEWLNNQDPAIILQGQEDGYVLFKGNVNGISTSFLFVGTAGEYGSVQLQATESDFLPIPQESIQQDYALTGDIANNLPDDFLIVTDYRDEIPMGEGKTRYLKVVGPEGAVSSIDLYEFIPEGTTSEYCYNITREKNSFIINISLGDFNTNTGFLILHDCKLINGEFKAGHWLYKDFTDIIGLNNAGTAFYRTDFSNQNLYNGYLYFTITRMTGSSVEGPPTVMKVNIHNLDDYEIFEITGQTIGACSRGSAIHRNYLYFTTFTTSTLSHLCRIRLDFTGFEILQSLPAATYGRFTYIQYFHIYNDEIYLPSATYAIPAVYNAINIIVYGIDSKRIVRTGMNLLISDNLNQYTSGSATSTSWISEFNDKLIVSINLWSGTKAKRLLRIDPKTLIIEEIAPLMAHGVSYYIDKTGFIYLFYTSFVNSIRIYNKQYLNINPIGVLYSSGMNYKRSPREKQSTLGWGNILGNIEDQNDLITSLNNKFAKSGGDITGNVTIEKTASNGLNLYNTTDKAINYEKLQINWQGNTANIRTLKNGTGISRNIIIGSETATLELSESAAFNTSVSGLTATQNNEYVPLGQLSEMILKESVLSVDSDMNLTAESFGNNGMLTIYADATNSEITINLIAAASMKGLTLNVMKTSGVGNVLLKPVLSETINGFPSVSITNSNQFTVVKSDGIENKAS